MASSTLQDIRNKVRLLTRRLDPSLMSDAALDQYINTAILYDFPEHLRLRTLKTVVTWYTQAYQDTYYVDTTLNVNDPLYDFENRYITIDTPCYIRGVRSFYTQSRDVFFGAYPTTSLIENFATGDGIVTFFGGTFDNFPVAQNTVIFSSIVTVPGPIPTVIPFVTLTYRDEPVPGNVDLGNLINVSTGVAVGTVNYVTGDYSLIFEYAPNTGANVVRQSLPYTASPPTALLYHNLSRVDAATGLMVNDKVFTVRPIPDGAYPISIEAYRQPIELLNSGDSPDLNQWWQYISYLSAKKIFEDYMETESIQQIMPALLEQQSLVLTKTVVQNTTQRAATIYSPQLDNNPYFGTWGWTNGPIG